MVVAAGLRQVDHTIHAQPGSRPAPETALVDRLSLRQQVGQLLIQSFPGATAPDYARRRLRDAEGAGVVLFGDNTATSAGLKRLTRSLQRTARGSALVMVDQEGGPIRNVRFAGPEQAQPQQVYPGNDARSAARQLRALGVNVNLAPVADVPGPGSVVAGRAFKEPVMGTRTAVSGYQSGRVGATVKHFPGFGGATQNTDDASVTIGTPPDLAPFRAAIARDVPLVMIAHATYPTIDKSHIASQSPAVIQTLLRKRLGFHGVAITDSIEAQAVIGKTPVDVAAERSIAAGCDLVLMTGSGSPKLVYPRLLAAARRSPSFRRRVRESAARVIQLKRRLGLRAPR